jgi:hypothetical protein
MATNRSINERFTWKYTCIATASLGTFVCMNQESPSRMEELVFDGKQEGKVMESLQNDWETFMIKSMDPNDDDDDDDDDDDEDEDDDDDEEEEDGEENEEEEDDEEEEEEDGEEIGEDNTGNDGEEGNLDETDDIIDEDDTKEGDEDKNEDNGRETQMDTETDELDANLNIDSNEVPEHPQQSVDIDPYDNLPEEDEPTSCVICLINRQGPCRAHWRKFERCMKDNTKDENSSEDNDNESSSTPSSSLGEKCDVYMLPWIRCIQEFRNKYTLISNSFFQKELIEDVESHISDDERILLDNIDPASIVTLGEDWYDAKAMVESTALETSETDATTSTEKDDVLATGIARINLWDQKANCPIEVAYVKDQDDKLLGYDQFFDFKKSIKSGEDKDGSLKKKVGACNFHVDPVTTKAIRIYALYRTNEENTDDTTVDNTSLDQDSPTRKKEVQTLYYSTPIGIDTIPVQEKHEAEESQSSNEDEDSSPVKHTSSNTGE